MHIFLLFLLTHAAWGSQRPASYTDLLDYVIEAPNQARTGACLYMGSTGAMEILANKKLGLKHQRPGDRFDLSERFLIHAPSRGGGSHHIQGALAKFNGRAVHALELPWEVDDEDESVGQVMWEYPEDFSDLPRISVPRVETTRLFVRGQTRWSTGVLSARDVETVKQALWQHKSPVVINYNDNNFWHVIVVVGYDDNLQDAACYDLEDEAVCEENQDGALYVRDSFGVRVESRDADWFRVKGNAAFVVKLAE